MGKLAILCLTACGRIGFDASGGDASHVVDRSGDGPPVLSCSAMTSTCGAGSAAPCCDNSTVPGGTFYRSYDVGSDGDFFDMTNPAHVSTFRLDTYEVTVGRFRKFVEAGMGTQANPPPTDSGARTLNGMLDQAGWDPAWNPMLATDSAALVGAIKCSAPIQTWTDTAGANETLPINCITWLEAFAFCTWDGGFLPTFAEWNYAAVGGDEQRAYPWSSPPSSLAIDCSYANYFNGSTYCGGVAAVTPVGAESPKGDGRWGQADLAGNVTEWTLDWFAVFTNPCDDCAALTVGDDRDTGGGDFTNSPIQVRAAYNTGFAPTDRSDIGTRCARPP